MIQFKETKKLFMDEYAYKAVLIVPGAHWFRGHDFQNVKEKLKTFRAKNNFTMPIRIGSATFKKIEDTYYTEKLLNLVLKLDDFEIRVETPYLSFYTNTAEDIDKLCALDSERVKYVSKPPVQGLIKNTVLMNRTGWDYKITLGQTRQSYQDFLEWADKTGDLVKLTGSSKKALARDNHWGGTHFYAKNDKAITMIRMFLGDSISRIDQVINPE